jgi:hypothetical protein
MMLPLRTLVSILALSGILPGAARAESPAVIVAGQTCVSDAASVCSAAIEALDADGNVVASRPLTWRHQRFFTDMALDASGLLHFVDQTRIRLLDERLEGDRLFGGRKDLVQSLSFDMEGNAWVGVFNFGRSTIRKYDSRGELVKSLKTPFGVYASDLAADQCTLFYLSGAEGEQTIRRYNVCAGQAMDDFGKVKAQRLHQLRIAPDGSVLVATSVGVSRLFPDGNTRTYNISGTPAPWRGLSIAPDGTSFWGTISNVAVEFDLDSGRTRRILFSAQEELTGIVVQNAWRAAASSSSRPAAPSDLQVAHIGDNRYSLTWTDNSSDETGFEIEYRVNFGQFKPLGSVDRNQTAVIVTGWKWARVYSFRVRARSATGVSGYSNEAGTYAE